MTPISGAGYGGFNPAELQKNMQQQFTAADVDESGSLSKSEATQSMSDKGMSESAIDKMFSKMDSNGDGEVTAEEQDAMFEQMQERMASMQSMMGGGAGKTDSASLFESLLESLSADQEDSDDDELDDLLEKLREDPNSEQVQKEAASAISQRIPMVDTVA